MNTQEAYETIRKHFSQPGAGYSFDGPLVLGAEGNGCMYRTPDGRKCAAGCLIPDHLYDPSFENKWIGDVVNSSEALQQLFDDVDPEFLARAQATHDDCARHNRPMVSFIKHLDGLAIDFNLAV